MTDLPRFSVTLPKDVASFVETISRATGTPTSKIIRELIERGLKAERAKEAGT